MEVVLLLPVYVTYGYNEGGVVGYILRSVSSWFMAISWLAPYLFNPSGFEWQKTVEDFRDWTNWLLYRGWIGVQGEESWEARWDAELVTDRSVEHKPLNSYLLCINPALKQWRSSMAQTNQETMISSFECFKTIEKHGVENGELSW